MSTWKALREKYRRERNKSLKTKSDMAAVYHRKWSLYDAISSSSQLYNLKSKCYFKCNETVFLYYCDLNFSKFVYISQNIIQSWTCNRQRFVFIPWKRTAPQDTWWMWFRQRQQWCINFVFGRVNVLFLGYVWIYHSGVASLKFWGGKIFNFRQITLFCMGYHLSRHKMTIYAKHFGGHGPQVRFFIYIQLRIQIFLPKPNSYCVTSHSKVWNPCWNGIILFKTVVETGNSCCEVI